MLAGERFNSCTHLLGTVVAAGCSVNLLARALGHAGADTAALAGAALFSLVAVLMYASSSAFHLAQGATRPMLERLDNGVIFLLIAGTYTPFALDAPRSGVNLCILAFIWAFALRACARAMVSHRPPDLKSYVFLGWIAVSAALPVAMRAGSESVTYLLLGALAYSGGTVFYVNPMDWRHAHGCWHLCVLGGTVAHFAAITRLMA